MALYNLNMLLAHLKDAQWKEENVARFEAYLVSKGVIVDGRKGRQVEDPAPYVAEFVEILKEEEKSKAA